MTKVEKFVTKNHKIHDHGLKKKKKKKKKELLAVIPVKLAQMFVKRLSAFLASTL